MNAPPRHTPPPRFLLCRPQHFAVTYSINPWMDPARWAQAHADEARSQWAALEGALREAGAVLEFVEPQAELPDLVFTANAAVVLDGKALLARFRHPERRREEPVFAAAFAALRAHASIEKIVELPHDIVLEGAGDCIYDPHRRMFFMGYGQRSDASAAAVVEEEFGVRCVPLQLASASFYHLDTALCALPCGGVIYHPEAFTAAALGRLYAHVGAADRIALTREDAQAFSANAVCVGRTIVMSSASDALRRQLAMRGYTVVATPLTAFLKSGGSACCLTLRLDRRTVVPADLPAELRAATGSI
ncbi:MAG TPA: arginine deiminase-related protein [Pseudolabrys sp.]|nr:arginine deiminase-related protein [Pseudolabrys sp.]